MNVLEMKAAVRERDGFRCTECGMTNEQHVEQYGRQLDVHRDPPGAPYAPEICTTVCRSCHGPKPRSPRYPKPRLDSKLVDKIRFLSRYHRVSVAEFLDPILRPFIDAEYKKMAEDILRDIAAEADSGPKTPRPKRGGRE